MGKSFFFYDLETSGLRAREDRIMQFAGQRANMELELVGEPVNILVKITDDCLPSPSAIKVTGITPQQTLMDGVSEAEFCRIAGEEIFTPGTIAVGYNTVRFDDEFMRAVMWRNFYDPYEWEWKDGRSRWDMLDVVRMVRALRPEGIEWPFREDGVPTNRLELLTAMNGLEHEHAHDALSDVYATIAVARLIREKQPKLFAYLSKMRDKNEVKKLVNLEDKKPFVYVSGRYSSEYNKATVAFPIAPGRHGNVLVYDLRYNLGEVMGGSCPDTFSSDTLKAVWPSLQSSEKVSRPPAQNIFPIVKELCYNKCPAVAPVGVLESGDGWEKIGLDAETVKRNLRVLLEHPEFAEQMRSEYEQEQEWPEAREPEAALYDGFLNDADRARVARVRKMSAEGLADFHPEFDDERLPELLLHYKGRNYPQTLSEAEMEKWEAYRRARLEWQAPKFLEELEKVEDEFLKEELLLYMQSLS